MTAIQFGARFGEAPDDFPFSGRLREKHFWEEPQHKWWLIELWNHHLVNPYPGHMSLLSGRILRTSLDRPNSCCRGALFVSLMADTPWLWQLAFADDSFNTQWCPPRSSLLQVQCLVHAYQCPDRALWQKKRGVEFSPLSIPWMGDQCSREPATSNCLHRCLH